MTSFNDDSERYGDSFAYCLAHWPALRRYVPEAAVPLERRFGEGDGACTHADAANREFVSSRGFEKFLAAPPVPDGFFWAGIQNRGGSEYMFAMWRVGARRFWFYDQYVVFVTDSDASVERTAGRLQEALRRWEEGGDRVAYSGPWGAYDAERGASEKEDEKGG